MNITDFLDKIKKEKEDLRAKWLKSLNTSKYEPHQGKKERERRIKRLSK